MPRYDSHGLRARSSSDGVAEEGLRTTAPPMIAARAACAFQGENRIAALKHRNGGDARPFVRARSTVAVKEI
jgi:hypothetical protein